MSEQRPTDDHDRYRDEVAVYALGALEPDDAAAVERHVRQCGRCRARLEWLQPALDVLPASVEQIEAPPELRERVLSAVREDARRQVTAKRARRPSWLEWLRFRPTAALAAAALLAGGVGVGYVVSQTADEQRTVVAAEPGAAAPQGQVAAALETVDGAARLHVSELPPLSGGRSYQAWIQREGRMEPSSVFALERNGTTVVELEGDLDGAQRVLVTEEPEGGSPSPTSAPLLSADLG